jgi:hypothetical protein
MGRSVYDAALTDADSLASVAAQPDVEEPVAPTEPIGERWNEEDLPRRFSRLWAQFRVT